MFRYTTVLMLLFTCIFHSILATETYKYPVDVCFMVADLKYSAKQGVKICEIQQGSLSVFNGDAFRDPVDGSIYKNFLHALSLYNQNGWVVADYIADKNLVSALASSPLWQTPKDMIALLSDSSFTYRAKQPVKEINDLSSYQGFLYQSWSYLSAIFDFEDRFSGMVVVDKSSFPFWGDKYKMTQLFADDEVLSTFKPKWGSYKKIYSKELAEKVAEDLQCDTFVIKPRGECLGNGVIITSRQNLDDVLFYIITKSGQLADSQDPAYVVWKQDPFDSFIVEEFVISDPIAVPHLGNKIYQPTMRMAFLLVYHQHCHHVHFLGGYWKTPSLSIEEEGDFMQKNKDICEPPYYCAVDPKTMESVENDLLIALPLLHSKMLRFCSDSEGDFTPLNRNKFQFILEERKNYSPPRH